MTARRRSLHHVQMRRTERNRERLKRTPEERLANRNGRLEVVRMYHGASVTDTTVIEGCSYILPSRLDIDYNLGPTMRTFTDLRQIFERWRRFMPRTAKGVRRPMTRSYVSLDQLDYVDLPSAIVLLAEFQRQMIVRNQRDTPLVDLHKWNPETVRRLSELGFFKVVGVKPGTVPDYPERPHIRILPFVSGSDGNQMERITSQIGELAQFLDPTQSGLDVTTIQVTTSISEAITNVTNHAYPRDHDYRHPHVGRFWFGATANRETGIVKVAFYDQGISVPVSYPKASRLSTLQNFFSNRGVANPNDASYIEAAVQLGSSQTGQQHRGRGLPQMRQTVDICPKGRFLIASRSGLYDFRGGTDERTTSFDGSVGGTLLYWEFGVGHRAKQTFK